jgi:hypothetical protein
VSASVFISHSGADIPTARAVTAELRKNGLEVALDREVLDQGDVFLAFMEEALASSTYCLLLWSHAAAQSKWVAVEWQSALYRTVQEARRFLLIGTLDDEQVPALLAPRLRTALYPALYPGLDALLAMWRADTAAEQTAQRPVASATVPLAQDEGAPTVYLSSELFGITLPLRLDLSEPAGVHIDRLAAQLGLPRQLDYEGVMGVRYEYRLVLDDQPLERNRPLSAQGVGPGTVLLLEVEMKPFAQSAPVAGQLAGARFRGKFAAGTSEGRKHLLAAIARAGLGPMADR